MNWTTDQVGYHRMCFKNIIVFSEIFNFDPDPRKRHTLWTMVVGGYFTWVSIYGINQTQVQRYLTVKKTSQAVK